MGRRGWSSNRARHAADRIGERARRVTLAAPTWVAETANAPACCRVDGVIEPVATSATARPINFAVALPAQCGRRAVQLGGGGMNGTIPNLTGGSGPGSVNFRC
jgi:feruloyl esterase